MTSAALTRASRFAYHETLTRLPNRRLLQYRLGHAADVTMYRNKVSSRTVSPRVLETA